MTDIFVSYSTADRETAHLLADALEPEGWNTWWDREIPAGVTFETYIEQRLNEATCAVVIWSKNSVDSMWVRAEANEAMAQKKLVPVLIDDSQPPLVFRQIQTADLRGWKGDRGDQRFTKLVGDLRNLIARSTLPATATAPETGGVDEPTVHEPAGRTEAAGSDSRAPSKQTGSGGGGRKWPWAIAATVAVLLAGVAAFFYLQPPEPPSISRFEARPDTIAEGGQSELVWETQSADVVTLLPDRRVKANDSLPVHPDTTTQYSLSAENRGGTTTQSVRVTVQTSARIDEFTAQPARVVEGDSTMLRWRTTGAVRVEIPGFGELNPSGRMELRPDRSTGYVLIAIGEDGKEVNQSVEIEVKHLPEARILSFAAEKANIERGEKTRLGWSTENAIGVEFGGKPVEASGFVTVAPSKTTIYELTATGESGDRTTQRTEVTVLAPSAAQILNFETKNPKIERGERTTLAWTTRDAVKVELNGKPVEPSGSVTVRPSKTTDYHLVATAKSGAMSDRVTKVTVAAPSEPERRWLVLSGGGQPLENDAVREALAVGVDWDAVLRQMMSGRDVAAALDIPIGSGRKPLADYRYDPALADKLLAEAGYPDGLEVYLYVDSQKMMEFGVLVAKYLYRVEVKANPSVIPGNAARSRADAAHQKRAKKPVLFLDLERP